MKKHIMSNVYWVGVVDWELKKFHDYLTGLYNRRYYEEELSRLDVDRNLPLTIVMGDVNGLKLVNDSFGHGDPCRIFWRCERLSGERQFFLSRNESAL